MNLNYESAQKWSLLNAHRVSSGGSLPHSSRSQGSKGKHRALAALMTEDKPQHPARGRREGRGASPARHRGTGIEGSSARGRREREDPKDASGALWRGVRNSLEAEDLQVEGLLPFFLGREVVEHSDPADLVVRPLADVRVSVQVGEPPGSLLLVIAPPTLSKTQAQKYCVSTEEKGTGIIGANCTIS